MAPITLGARIAVVAYRPAHGLMHTAGVCTEVEGARVAVATADDAGLFFFVVIVAACDRRAHHHHQEDEQTDAPCHRCLLSHA
jgi:hypothetical protein